MKRRINGIEKKGKMQTARNQNQQKINAWQAERGDKYVCPECESILILKRGRIKEAHFAHKPDAECSYSGNETVLHLKIKREIYEALVIHPNCHRPELERRLDGVRPDISLYIGRCPVAIEIQRSDIGIDAIAKRTTRYSELGIWLVWILPKLKSIEDVYVIGNVYQARAWQRFLHRLQSGRVYVWQQGAVVKPIHLEPLEVWREEYEDYATGNNYGGYHQKLKTRFVSDTPDKEILHLADDFEPITRLSFMAENQYMPETKIWSDNLDRWWIDET